MITYAEAAQHIKYDPETGKITRTSGKFEGRVVGYLKSDGYITVRILEHRIFAHRLAFLMMTGSFPEHDVDHINNIKSDNRWVNLRPCTRSQNSHNASLRSDNVSGYKGVSWSKRHQKWYAQLMVDGKLMNLGYYTTPEEGDRVVREARIKHHRNFANHAGKPVMSLEERIKNKVPRAPREKYFKKATGFIRPSSSEYNKATNMRKRAREGYYEPEVCAQILSMSASKMKELLPIWEDLNTDGRRRIYAKRK